MSLKSMQDNVICNDQLERRILPTSYHSTYDLEKCSFTYKGRIVPGKTLAALLGITSEGEQLGSEHSATQPAQSYPP